MKTKTLSKLAASIAAVLLLTAAPAAIALPNLTPYLPSGWSDKIVVSKTTGTTTDSSPLYTTDTLYVDWAVINNGTAATGAFYTYLYVDGVYKTFGYIGSLNANTYTYWNDYSIGSLSAGTHTIMITADATGAVAESNEGDNSYTKTITVSSLGQPNLTPYQPSGWSDKIVVSKVTGTTTDSSPLYTTDTLYVDLAVINNGTASAGAFYTYIYVDGTYKGYMSTTSLGANNWTYVYDFSIGSLSAGTHTIMITADATYAITESNESDNSYTKTITVIAPSLPNLTPYKPTYWSDMIVVSRTPGNYTDSTGLTTADTLYLDWAAINSGTAAAGAFYIYIYVDGTYRGNSYTASLAAGAYTYANDFNIGSLGVGTHTIMMTADATGAVTESNESDNSYTKTISVGAPVLPNLTPYAPSGWSDKIVVSRTTGTTTDSTGLTTADTLYVDWTVINSGAAATVDSFYTTLYVDGSARQSWSTAAGFAVNAWAQAFDFSLGSLSAGTHTLTITADATGTITESNESDNSYTKTITVGAASAPNLTPYSPSGWSDKIVVSRATGNNTDSTGLTIGDSLYVDWAVLNNGNAAATALFYDASQIIVGRD